MYLNILATADGTCLVDMSGQVLGCTISGRVLKVTLKINIFFFMLYVYTDSIDVIKFGHCP